MVEWQDGGSEPFKWTTDGHGHGIWSAVWREDDAFIAWVSSHGVRQVAHRPTEDEAMRWCENMMKMMAAT